MVRCSSLGEEAEEAEEAEGLEELFVEGREGVDEADGTTAEAGVVAVEGSGVDRVAVVGSPFGSWLAAAAADAPICVLLVYSAAFCPAPCPSVTMAATWLK
jgi:hypothetical protein